MPDSAESGNMRLKPFWSGTIAFGLVSLPVSLYVANRARSVSLRLVDADGTPLSRRYLCPAEGKLLADDEIVRGFEIGKSEFVVVNDDELDGLAPEKSQEIDLRRFVARDEIDPVYFERAYFLAPGKGASKAYRLLARAMEESERAGIATFVMRGKEYLVAIIAEAGILRAETLRFHDELRSPEQVGLPSVTEVSAATIQDFEQEIEALSEEELDRSALADRQAARLLELVQHKLSTGHDVVAAPEELEPEEGDPVIDLMQVLKRSLEQADPKGTGAAVEARRASGSNADGRLGERSKDELYEQAKEMNIAGRSAMTKQQLIEAIRRPG